MKNHPQTLGASENVMTCQRYVTSKLKRCVQMTRLNGSYHK